MKSCASPPRSRFRPLAAPYLACCASASLISAGSGSSSSRYCSSRASCFCYAASVRLLLPRQLAARECRACRQRLDLLVAHVARRPAESAVGVDLKLLGRADGQHTMDAFGHVLRSLRIEALHVD